MAGAGLLALLDDITTLLDDVSVLTKITAKKTAGVLGDDLALNAEQVSGVRAERELAIVWAVAKGSAKNKAILVPLALLLSAFIPWLITPLLMLGGAFLCFEGFEKIVEALFHRQESTEHATELKKTIGKSKAEILAYEQKKIKGAIRTDFILSAEIVVIGLGIVQSASLLQQVVVLVLIAAAITIGVYGIVAAIVKLDDLGLYLINKEGSAQLTQTTGRLILNSCPYLMKTLSIAGTAAMFLVGGGILLHNLPFGHDLIEAVEHWPGFTSLPVWFVENLVNALAGLISGGVLVGIYSLFGMIKKQDTQ